MDFCLGDVSASHLALCIIWNYASLLSRDLRGSLADWSSRNLVILSGECEQNKSKVSSSEIEVSVT